MRTLLAALILTLPLLAQDKPASGDKAKGKAGHKHAEIEKIIKELESQLGKENDEAIRKVIEQLREVAKASKRIGAFVFEGVPEAEERIATVRLMLAPGGETMQGSFEENGNKGTYTLKSGKDGTYTLDAEITGDGDKLVKRVKDTGTFAELRAKYKWLQGGVMFAAGKANRGDRDFWQEVRLAKPVIGVNVRAPSDELRHHLEIPVGGGLVVWSVAPGSRADKLGLRKFDLLMRIDGDLVDDPEQVKKLAGKGATLEYVRRARKKRLVTAE